MSVILYLVGAVVIALILVYLFKGAAKKGTGSWEGTQKDS
jgi:hypothetical protein